MSRTESGPEAALTGNFPTTHFDNPGTSARGGETAPGQAPAGRAKKAMAANCTAAAAITSAWKTSW